MTEKTCKQQNNMNHTRIHTCMYNPKLFSLEKEIQVKGDIIVTFSLTTQ